MNVSNFVKKNCQVLTILQQTHLQGCGLFWDTVYLPSNYSILRHGLLLHNVYHSINIALLQGIGCAQEQSYAIYSNAVQILAVNSLSGC